MNFYTVKSQVVARMAQLVTQAVTGDLRQDLHPIWAVMGKAVAQTTMMDHQGNYLSADFLGKQHQTNYESISANSEPSQMCLL